MTLRMSLLAATVALPATASAQLVSGLYIGAGAGASFLQDQSVPRTSFPLFRQSFRNSGAGQVNVQADTGFVGVGSAGFGLGNGLRFELEGSYRQNGLSRVAGSSHAPLARAAGDEKKYGGMVNVLYDIDPGSFGAGSFPVYPYIGVGAGYHWAQEQNARIFTTPSNGFSSYRINDGKGALAYQAILGLAYPITAVPGLSLTAEYRFTGLATNRTYNAQYSVTAATPSSFAGAVATRARLTFDEDYNHGILIGVRYSFNHIASDVFPQTVGTIHGDSVYLIFFAWDRADLNDRARQVIAAAAAAITRVPVTRIEVEGHTDTSGTARYNQALSVRRAQIVAAELIRLGIPRDAITTQGFGFTHPLVPTGPGVREPQNRRVQINMR